jgi:hypothetical protein
LGTRNGWIDFFIKESPKGSMANGWRGDGWRTLSSLIFVPSVPGLFIEVRFLSMSVSYIHLLNRRR